MRKILLLAIILISSISFSQKLKFKIIGQKDTTVHLVRYYGKNLYYADTALIKGGDVVFDGSKQKPGILAVLMPGQKYFEFIYNNEDVTIETSTTDFIQTMKVKKSEENKVFVTYMQYLAVKRKESSTTTEKEKLKAISDEVVQYQKDLIANNPARLVSKIVKMSMDIVIPPAPKDKNGVIIDSLFQYHFYRTHYFDNVDLKDERLVNTPIFQNKVEGYFSKNMMVQHWDTIIKYGYDFLDRLDQKTKTFEFCLTWITSNYEKSNIMGMDKVFVKMAERYYCSQNSEGKSPAFWMPEEKLKELCERANAQKYTILGIVPPNICLKDSSDTKWQDYYSLKSEYTILYFWDPECGHCKKTTPKLQRLYAEKFKARNIEVFAVSKAIDKDFELWKKFIKDNHLTFINVALTDALYKAAMTDARPFLQFTTLEALNFSKTFDIYSTPRVFVLDKDKKIIAKQLSISQLEDFLDKLQNIKDAPKLFPPDPEEDEQMKQ
ncbi:MAG: redoxin domain-containing protein [Flavobacteriia bacterium]|nr:redoxin domain-containing protein [Flavobacteriia bacterium]